MLISVRLFLNYISMALSRVYGYKDYSSNEVSTKSKSVNNHANYTSKDVYQESNIRDAFSMIRNRHYSLPRNSEVQKDPYFSIFNNMVMEGVEVNTGARGLNKNEVKDGIRGESKILSFIGEAVSSHDSKGPRLTSSVSNNSGTDYYDVLDVIRRRESAESRGRELGNSQGSRRRKTLNDSINPTNFGKNEVHLSHDEVGTKWIYSDKLTLEDMEGQESNDHNYQGDTSMNQLGNIMAKLEKDAQSQRINRVRTNQRDKPNYGLDVTETSRQSSEGLVREGQRTYGYDDPTHVASGSSKDTKHLTKQRFSPNTNRAGKETPGSASGGQHKKFNATNHHEGSPKERKKQSVDQAVKNIEDKALADHMKSLRQLHLISREKSKLLNINEPGIGEKRDDLINEMSASKTPVRLLHENSSGIKELNISKMELMMVLTATAESQIERMLHSLRDVSEEPLKNEREAIMLVGETLLLTEELKEVLKPIYGDMVKTLIEQHQGVLNELKLMREEVRYMKWWIPTDPIEVKEMF